MPLLPLNPQYIDNLKQKTSNDPQNIKDQELEHLYHYMSAENAPGVPEQEEQQDLMEIEQIKTNPNLWKMLKSNY